MDEVDEILRKGGVEVMEDEVGKYTIAIASALSSVEAHRIRRYERVGLIKPVRSEGGQRLYSDANLERIKEIASLESQGVNLAGAGIILAMRHQEE